MSVVDPSSEVFTLSLPPAPKFSPRSLLSRLADQVALRSSHLAVADLRSKLTFSELDSRSTQVARHLLDAGIGVESCVALFFDRSVDFVVAAVAVLKAGAAYLPLDPQTPMDRLRYIASDARASVILTHRGKSSGLSAAEIPSIELESVRVSTPTADAAGLAEHIAPPTDRLAYVIYTSGSTGAPKGVEITHGNLLNLIDWHQSAFHVTASDRASQIAGLGFDAAVWELWPHLTAGASVHLPEDSVRRSPTGLRDWLVAQQITISFVPTLLAEQLLHIDWPAGTKLHTLLTGADTLHRRPKKGLPFRLINNYGPTECTVVATSGVVSEVVGATTGARPSIGRPISRTQAIIVDDALHPVPAGEPGELCLAGALVGRGYRNQPALTAQLFIDLALGDGNTVRAYRTGDRVRQLPTGELEFLGRVDQQIKLRGYRIELGEIVANLNKYLGVESSAVVLREDPSGGELVAYLVAEESAKLNAVDLKSFLAARLPEYMVPGVFVQLDGFPITANGKIDKSALPAPTPANILPGSTSTGLPAAPGTTDPAAAASNSQTAQVGIESRIAEMVSALLGKPTIARNANFFMAGGHSMLGVQLAARLRDTFGVQLNLRQLFGAPTVEKLTAEVEKLIAASKK